MGTGSFPGVKSSREVTLTPHNFLVPWSRKSRAIPLLPLLSVRPVQSLSACTVQLYLYSPYGPYGLYRAPVPVQYSYTSTPPMGRTACTEPQCLYSTAIPLLPLWTVRPVQTLSACTRLHFTCFTLTDSCIISNKYIDSFCLPTYPHSPTEHPLTCPHTHHTVVILCQRACLSQQFMYFFLLHAYRHIRLPGLIYLFKFLSRQHLPFPLPRLCPRGQWEYELVCPYGMRMTCPITCQGHGGGAKSTMGIRNFNLGKRQVRKGGVGVGFGLNRS